MNENGERTKIEIIISFFQNIRLAFNMFRDYFKGEYRDVSWKTFLGVIAALVYMVSPIGITLGMIPVLGWIDDIMIIVLLIRLMHEDLEKYRKFKDEVK